MLRGLHFILFEKTNTPCNIGESYRCGIGNPYRAASIHHYQRVVHVRTCCVVYILIFGSLPNAEGPVLGLEIPPSRSISPSNSVSRYVSFQFPVPAIFLILLKVVMIQDTQRQQNREGYIIETKKDDQGYKQQNIKSQ